MSCEFCPAVGGGCAVCESLPGFDPARAVLVAADDVSSLRRVDVFRVLEWSPAGERAAVAAYLRAKRPDLGAEVAGCLADLAAEASA